MLRLVFLLLALALVAGIVGYSGFADDSWHGARTYMVVFLALAALTFLFGGGFGRRSA
jgi:uncharacterized membrane protein YtjA (UPF0391 family)